MLPSTGLDCHGLPMQLHHLFRADSSHLELYSASPVWRPHDSSVEPSFVDCIIMRRYSYDAMKDVSTSRSDVGLQFPSSFNVLGSSSLRGIENGAGFQPAGSQCKSTTGVGKHYEPEQWCFACAS